MRASLPGAESVRLDVSAFNSAPTASTGGKAIVVHLEQAYSLTQRMDDLTGLLL